MQPSKSGGPAKNGVPKLEQRRVGLVGNQHFVATRITLRKLMGDQCALPLCLCFMGRVNRLPKFAFSTTSPKELFVESTAFSERLYQHLPGVTVHHWSGERDEREWNAKKRLIGNREPIRITFRRSDKEPGSITMIFSHGPDVSAEYSYKPGLDAYFAMFMDFDDFKRDRTLLLSTDEFLAREVVMRKEKCLAPIYEPRVCLACMTDLAPNVNLPCGHVTVCRHCFPRTKGDKRCMLCKCEVTARVQIRVAAPYCVVCPPSWNCPVVETMLMPCRHVVGCYETTRLTLTEQASQCPECGSTVNQLVKLFF